MVCTQPNRDIGWIDLAILMVGWLVLEEIGLMHGRRYGILGGGHLS